MAVPVHVFSTRFESEEEADAFFVETYDESGDEVSCPLWEDLGIDWLDHDRLELIFNESDRIYLSSVVPSKSAQREILEHRDGKDNSWLFIYDTSESIPLASRRGKKLNYLGTYESSL